MTFTDDLKLTLEQRLELLDGACDSETPGTSLYGELCGRYEECKAILALVNILSGEDEAPCTCNDYTGCDGCGNCCQRETAPDVQARAEVDAHLNRVQELADINRHLAEATIIQQGAKLDCYHALKDAGLPIPLDLKRECEQPHCT